MDIAEFLNSNGIVIGDENFQKINKDKYLWNSDNQISLIVEIQKILMRTQPTLIPRIESSIGKEIEGFIVQGKKAMRMISVLEEKSHKDDFDYYIIEQGNKIINRAKKSLDSLDETEYLKIIVRSMNNNEICLGRVDEGNLQKDNMTIKIRTIRYAAYNMVEHDCYNYIRRLKRRRRNVDINTIIKDFVYKSKLEEESIRYLKMLSSYPIESIKMLLKIKYDRDKFTNDNWIQEINIAEVIDGIELL